jgi:hypothetical protein
MREVTLFHTVKDKKNPDEVNAKGPFVCVDDAWLGIGYYFWDSHIELAHWWGDRHCKKNYMICRAEGIIDDRCLDLLDGRQRVLFQDKCKEFLRRLGKKQHQVLLPEMLTYWISLEGDIFNSVRAVPTSFNGFAMNTTFKLKFSNRNAAFFDFNLPVQICLYDKKALSLQDFRVIYPERYVKIDYA